MIDNDDIISKPAVSEGIQVWGAAVIPVQNIFRCIHLKFRK
jgi:hypothetical protein